MRFNIASDVSTFTHQKQYLVVWALGFICDVSERFTRNPVCGLENKFIPTGSDNSNPKNNQG